MKLINRLATFAIAVVFVLVFAYGLIELSQLIKGNVGWML